jgi:hypothetical protein
MTNGHRNAEDANQPSFNLSAMSIIAFCRAIDSGNSPTAELDMFSRWIRLSDRALDAKQNICKQSRSRGRRKCKTILSAKPA